uniref:BTB domain containing 19 n=1 Tax=Leptobrachium leishanense TaxID=445787 RepID=A0A8C5QR87_9ANUR
MAQCPAKAKPAGPSTLHGDISCLPAALRGLIDNPQFSDVTFVVGKRRQVIHAHRCILASRCKVFHGMFVNQSEERTSPEELRVPFVLADTHPDVFLAVLEFLYTNSVTLSSPITLEVLTSAVEYGLDDLRKLCVEFISKTLTVELACEALQAAVTYGQTDLIQNCLSFIERHTTKDAVGHMIHYSNYCHRVKRVRALPATRLRDLSLPDLFGTRGHLPAGTPSWGPQGSALTDCKRSEEIIKTQGFRELSDLGLLSILQSNRLAIDEVLLIHAVREWAHVSSVVLDAPVSVIAKEVVKELRLFLLSPEELTTLEEENRQDNLIPESQVAQAWKFHALKKISDFQLQRCQRRKGTLPREHHRYLEPHAK